MFNLVAVVLATASVVAHVCPEQSARWSRGPVTAAAADGEVGVLLSGSTVVVVDLSDFASVEVVGEIAARGLGVDVALAGGLASIATPAGITLVDVSEPASPVEDGHLDLGAVVPSRLAPDGTRLYVTSDAGLHIVDITDPAEPTVVGSFAIGGDEYESALRPVAVSGSLVCVATYGGHDPFSVLRVLSVADPTSPTELARWQDMMPFTAVTMTAGGGYVMFTNSLETQVFDLAEPASPQLAATIPVGGLAADLGGNRLIIADQGVEVIDVSDPSAPEEQGQLGLSGPVPDVALASPALALAALATQGAATVNLTDAEQPVVADTLQFPGPQSFTDVALDGGVLWSATPDGVWTLSIRAGGVIETLANLQVSGSEIRLADSMAYLASSSQVHAVDAVDPTAPVLLGSLDVGPGWPRSNAFAVSGGRVFRAIGHFLHVLDFSDPAMPRELSRTETSVYVRSLAAAGELVAVGSESPVGVLLAAVAEDGNVTEVGWVEPPPPPATSTTVFDGWASVTDLDIEDDLLAAVFCEFVPIFGGDAPICSLALIDVGDPEHPVMTGNTTWQSDSDFLPEVSLEGSLAVVTRPGIQVVSVLDRTQPTIIGSAATGGSPVGVSLDGTTAAVANGSAGLEAYSLSACSPAYEHRSWVPAAAHIEGAAGTSWRTDLEVYNHGDVAVAYSLELLLRGQANPSPPSVAFTLGPRMSVRYEDVVRELFGVEGAGSIRVACSAEHTVVTSRTFNDDPDGTFGQLIPGFPEASAIVFGQTGHLIQLSRSASPLTGFRTNLGVVNTTAQDMALKVELHSSTGELLGVVTRDLLAFEHQQINDVFAAVGAQEVPDGFAIVRTTTPGGAFFAYASVVDNLSGDPVYLPASTVE